jgi:hypothetical protein
MPAAGPFSALWRGEFVTRACAKSTPKGGDVSPPFVNSKPIFAGFVGGTPPQTMIHVVFSRRRREKTTPSHAWAKHPSIESAVT